MKRMVFIVVLMSFVASGALTGLIVLDIIPNPFADSERDMAESGGEEGGEAGGGGTPSFVPPERALILMPLEDIVIPVIIDARVIKRVYITARMEIPRGNRSAVENGLSRMESALNENLMVYF